MTKLYATKELKKARIRKNWSQQEFGGILRVQCGVKASHSAVQKWEDGRRPIMPETALEMARILRVQVDEIVERREVATTTQQ